MHCGVKTSVNLRETIHDIFYDTIYFLLSIYFNRNVFKHRFLLLLQCKIVKTSGFKVLGSKAQNSFWSSPNSFLKQQYFIIFCEILNCNARFWLFDEIFPPHQIVTVIFFLIWRSIKHKRSRNENFRYFYEIPPYNILCLGPPDDRPRVMFKLQKLSLNVGISKKKMRY